MVLFQNINVKARIEVLWRGDIHEGTVRYTGVLVARPGEWVGVELDRAGKIIKTFIDLIEFD